MTKEEWYDSPDFIKLRFLNNIAADIQHRTQELYDVLALIATDKEGIIVSNNFNLVERQLRIVNLEASKLWEYCRRLETSLQPKLEESNDAASH